MKNWPKVTPEKAAPVTRTIYWPCAGGLSALNAIGTHLHDPINSRPTRWRLTLYIYARRRGKQKESRKSKHNINERGGAGWRGTGLAIPSLETKFSGANGDREILIFPVELTTSRIGKRDFLAKKIK